MPKLMSSHKYRESNILVKHGCNPVTANNATVYHPKTFYVAKYALLTIAHNILLQVGIF